MTDEIQRVRLEVSAGGIVFKQGKGGPFLAFILDPFGKWTFAKGHVEKGEKSEAAALREVEEEMGIRGLEAVEYLGKIDFWFKERGITIHKFVYYYLMEAPKDARAVPQKEELIQEVRWVPFEKAAGFSSYKDVESVLGKAISILKKNIK